MAVEADKRKTDVRDNFYGNLINERTLGVTERHTCERGTRWRSITRFRLKITDRTESLSESSADEDSAPAACAIASVRSPAARRRRPAAAARPLDGRRRRSRDDAVGATVSVAADDRKNVVHLRTPRYVVVIVVGIVVVIAVIFFGRKRICARARALSLSSRRYGDARARRTARHT